MTVLRRDKGKRAVVTVASCPDDGRISSANRKQRNQVEKAIERLPSNLLNLEYNAEKTLVREPKRATNTGVRIDQQRNSSKG